MNERTQYSLNIYIIFSKSLSLSLSLSLRSLLFCPHEKLGNSNARETFILENREAEE